MHQQRLQPTYNFLSSSSSSSQTSKLYGDDTLFIDLTDSQLSLFLDDDDDDDDQIEDRGDCNTDNPHRCSPDHQHSKNITFSESLEEVFEITPLHEQLRIVNSTSDDYDDLKLETTRFNTNKDIWYEHSDMKIFRKQTREMQSRRVLHRPSTSSSNNNDIDCGLGLERVRTSLIKSVVDAVLTEQECQKEKEGVVTFSEHLSSISRSISNTSVEEATQRGIRLQNDIHRLPSSCNDDDANSRWNP